MGLLGKVLFGAMLNNASKNNSMSSGSQSNGYKRYECRYCGIRRNLRSRPSPKLYGPCKNSPYGTHYWDEV